MRALTSSEMRSVRARGAGASIGLPHEAVQLHDVAGVLVGLFPSRTRTDLRHHGVRPRTDLIDAIHRQTQGVADDRMGIGMAYSLTRSASPRPRNRAAFSWQIAAIRGFHCRDGRPVESMRHQLAAARMQLAIEA